MSGNNIFRYVPIFRYVLLKFFCTTFISKQLYSYNNITFIKLIGTIKNVVTVTNHCCNKPIILSGLQWPLNQPPGIFEIGQAIRYSYYEGQKVVSVDISILLYLRFFFRIPVYSKMGFLNFDYSQNQVEKNCVFQV